MNPLRIEQMTIFDVEPAEVVTIAAELAVPNVSFFTTQGMPEARRVTKHNIRRVLERLHNTPVTVDTVECFVLGSDALAMEHEIALAAELGASAITSINVYESDEDRSAEQLAGLCALADRYGLLVSLEFISMGTTRTPAQALRVVHKSGASNARITVDLLHVMRTATPFSEISALDPALISSIQICDGPEQIDDKELIEEASYSRMIPGTGAFPLAAFLKSIPATVPMGVEVPLRALREGGMSARDRTRLVVEAARALQQSVRR